MKHQQNELTEVEKVLLKQLQQYGSTGIANPCTCGLVAVWIDYRGDRLYIHAVTAKYALETLLKRLEAWERDEVI